MIIIIKIVLVLSRQNIDIFTDIYFDIFEKIVKIKCFMDVDNMTNEELINKVDNLRYSEEIDFIIGEIKGKLAYKENSLNRLNNIFL